MTANWDWQYGPPEGRSLSTMAKATRILIVEDHPAVREMVASEFELAPDFEIVGQALSLAEARRMLGGVDVVILDLGLPDGSGVELIPELLDANPDAHAIVLSADAPPAIASCAIERGATAVLDKVTHLGQVAQTTRTILAERPPLPAKDINPPYYSEVLGQRDHSQLSRSASCTTPTGGPRGL
jgi:DNA-binding NarL/FixJ family response regulator